MSQFSKLKNEVPFEILRSLELDKPAYWLKWWRKAFFLALGSLLFSLRRHLVVEILIS